MSKQQPKDPRKPEQRITADDKPKPKKVKKVKKEKE